MKQGLIQKLSLYCAERFARTIDFEIFREQRKAVINRFGKTNENFDESKLNKSNQINVYTSFFEYIFGSILKLILFIGISWLLGCLIPAFVLMISFAGLRVLAGGYHMQTYGKCLWFSLGIFIAISYMAKSSYINWCNTDLGIYVFLTCLFGMCVVYLYAPKDNSNKRITKPKKIAQFKQLSLSYIFIWTSLMFILLGQGFNLLVLSSCFGILLVLFNITPIGYYWLAKLDNNQEEINLLTKI